MVILRQYGAATVVEFDLYDATGLNFKMDAVHEDGDVKIRKDGGSENNTENGFSDAGRGYQIALSATEMQAKRIKLYIIDQTDPKVWLDWHVMIETYGHEDAQHPTLPANIKAINDDTTAPALQANAIKTVLPGTVSDANFTPTATKFRCPDVTIPNASRVVGRRWVWERGSSLEFEGATIQAYSLQGGEGEFTVSSMTGAPVNGDRGMVV